MAYIGKERNAKTTKNSLGKQKYRREADIKLEKNKGCRSCQESAERYTVQ